MIEQQGVRCPACNDRIFSNDRHDFVRCTCRGSFVDGGFDYLRYGGLATPRDVITRKLAQQPKRRYRK